MSICRSSVALNTGLLAMYGYGLYNLHQEKSERSNSHIALAVESNIDPALKREIENELKPLIGNKRLILCNARHDEMNPEKAIEEASVGIPTSNEEIVVNPDFYKKDKEACKVLVKWHVDCEGKMYDYLHNRSLVKIIIQVATTALSVCNNWSLLGTVALNLYLQILICPRIFDLLHKVPTSIFSTSSANELIATRRIFKVFENLYRPTKRFEIRHFIKEYREVIDYHIQVKKVKINVKQEEEKIQSLQDYFQSFMNLKLTPSPIE